MENTQTQNLPASVNAGSSLVTLDSIYKMADTFAKSRLFGFNDGASAAAVMLVAQAEGINPVLAMQQYQVVQGRPTLRAEAYLVRFQQAGGKIRWVERTASRCELWLSHPQAGELTVVWDTARAQVAGLANKDNWKKHPVQMLAARCISEGVRALYPSCCCGVYTPEEAEFFETPKASNGGAGTADPTPAGEPVAATSANSATKKKAAKKADAPKPAADVIDAEVVAPEPVPEPEPEPAQEPEATKPQKTRRQKFAESMETLWAKAPDAYGEYMKAHGYKSLEDIQESDWGVVYVDLKNRINADLAKEQA